MKKNSIYVNTIKEMIIEHYRHQNQTRSTSKTIKTDDHNTTDKDPVVLNKTLSTSKPFKQMIKSKTTDSSSFQLIESSSFQLIECTRESTDQQQKREQKQKLPSKADFNCSASSDGEGTEDETLRVAIFFVLLLSLSLCGQVCMLRVEADR